MCSGWILTVALMGPPSALPQSTINRFEMTSGETVEAKIDRDLDPGELRELYRTALRKTAKNANAKPEDAVMDLLKVYTEAARTEGLASTEVKRMRRVVKIRLEQLRGRMIFENLRRKKNLDRDRRRSKRKSGGPVSNRTAHLAGASEIQCANELIALIQTTIEPESWEVNGGNGTIYYFPLLKVLVVRQTQRIHEQIGGVLGGVKK